MFSTVLSGAAHAQAALDESKKEAAPASGDASAPPPAAEEPKNPVEYGVGLRLRNVRIPKFELELFTERATGGVSNVGFGVEFTRRRGNVELQLGLEFEHLQPPEGVFIESGANVATGDEADYILGPDRADASFGWVTIDFAFLAHTELAKNFYLRYGGGFGIGILTGSLKRIDVACAPGATNDNPEPGCVPPPQGTAIPTQGGVPVKYDMPSPVYPVFIGIIGAQYRPIPKATVNFEMGLRTVFFLGLSGSYFF